jgi:hypothetical protein
MTEHMQPSALDLNFDDIYEEETIPADQEVQLRVIRAEIVKSRNSGRWNLHVVFDVPDNDRVADIHLYMGVPTDEDEQDPKRVNRMKKRIAGFYEACGVDYSSGSVAMTDLVGCTPWAQLGEEDDPEYGKRNTVRTFVEGA